MQTQFYFLIQMLNLTKEIQDQFEVLLDASIWLSHSTKKTARYAEYQAITLQKRLSVSELVCLFVCSLTPPKRQTPIS